MNRLIRSIALVTGLLFLMLPLIGCSSSSSGNDLVKLKQAVEASKKPINKEMLLHAILLVNRLDNRILEDILEGEAVKRPDSPDTSNWGKSENEWLFTFRMGIGKFEMDYLNASIADAKSSTSASKKKLEEVKKAYRESRKEYLKKIEAFIR